jgi:hypothetical protein
MSRLGHSLRRQVRLSDLVCPLCPRKQTSAGPNAKLCRIPSRRLSHEPENLHDNSQRDLWSSSPVPCVTNFLWLAGRNRRLDGTDVVKLDRSRRRRRLELLRNKPRHAWLSRESRPLLSAACAYAQCPLWVKSGQTVAG